MEPSGEGTPHLTADLGGSNSEAGEAGGGTPLPCQNSHNSITGATQPPEFSPSARRTAYALQANVKGFVERHGIERVGFLTLTFADHVLVPKEAQRRQNSLSTNVLRKRYVEHLRVFERQKSGRIHYHLLVALHDDIRTGCDFEAFARGEYRSAPAALRAEWSFWRRTAKEYGFGRTELLPVRSSIEAIGRYVGKYIGKHLTARESRDHGVRLVTYSCAKVATTRFAWTSPGAQTWRRNLGAFVTMMHECGAIKRPTTEAMADRFGPRWAWYWRDSIIGLPVREPDDVQAEGDKHTEQELLGVTYPCIVGGYEPANDQRPARTLHGLPRHRPSPH